MEGSILRVSETYDVASENVFVIVLSDFRLWLAKVKMLFQTKTLKSLLLVGKQFCLALPEMAVESAK
jgi:hypothetical protein